MSAVGAAAGWSAFNPVTGETLIVKSLLSEQSLQLLITEIPRTYAAFAPLGLVLTVMLGAGVADRSGLFAALVRASLSAVHGRALVPAVMLTGMLTCHAVDAGYVVFVPLAGLIFASAGRHPILGLTVGFAGCGRRPRRQSAAGQLRCADSGHHRNRCSADSARLDDESVG